MKKGEEEKAEKRIVRNKRNNKGMQRKMEEKGSKKGNKMIASQWKVEITVKKKRYIGCRELFVKNCCSI